MGRKRSPTSEMDVAEKQATPLAQTLSELITDSTALKEHLGVSLQAVNQYRLGIARPTLENLCKIADFYGVTTDYLLGRTKAKTWDEDILKIQTMTGLNEYSAARLTEYQKAVTTNPHANIKARFFLHTINAILEANWFTECLKCVWRAYQVVHQRGGGGLFPRYPEQAEADELVKEAEDKFNECIYWGLTDKRIVSGEVAKSVLLSQAAEWFSAILKKSIEEEI